MDGVVMRERYREREREREWADWEGDKPGGKN